MRKVIRLTENDLHRIVKRVLKENFLTELPLFNQILSGSGRSKDQVKGFCNQCMRSRAQSTAVEVGAADAINDAVQGLGTDEDAIFRTFNNLRSFESFCGLVKEYQKSYGESLYDALDGDIDAEGEWVQIFRPIRNLFLKAQQSATQQQPQARPAPAPPRPGQPQARPATRPSQPQARPGQPSPRPAQPQARPATRPSQPQAGMGF